MKLFRKCLGLALSGVMLVGSAAVPAAASVFEKKDYSGYDYIEGEAIVVLKDDASGIYTKKNKSAAAYGSGISLENSYNIDADAKDKDSLKLAVVKSDKLSTAQLIPKLEQRSGVDFAVPNFRAKVCDITDDTYSSFQWALENKGHQGGKDGCDIKPQALWDKAKDNENEVLVAVLDTGIDFDHEDLKDVIWTNPFGSKLVGKHGYDFTYANSDGEPRDDHGHGTHVSGIIAGMGDNQKGISGINKSSVKILPIKCLDAEGSMALDTEIAALDYLARAVKLGANITAVNCSWGGIGDASEKKLYEKIFSELGSKGVISVFAAGNESADISEEQSSIFGDGYVLPAAINCDTKITVAASDEKDGLAGFSNYSEKFVDVAAPGTQILSCVHENTFNPSIYSVQQKAELVKEIQDYNGELKDGDFGYPVVNKNGSSIYPISENIKVEQGDRFFGDSGKSVKISFTDEKIETEEKANVEETETDSELYFYSFELPFTLDNKLDPYSVSFMFSGSQGIEWVVLDVPADKEITAAEVNSFLIIGGGYGEDWDHYQYRIEPKKQRNYTRSTDRKLVFFAYANGGDSICIDDFAVSKQGVEEEEFGKYDFKGGTSMAAPYVTGAAALVKRAYPDFDVKDIISVICQTGRYSEALEGKLRNPRVLCLDDADKVPPMITSAKYSSDGKSIEINGRLDGVTTVKIDGTEVSPTSKTDDKITIPDKGWNVKTVTITVESESGSSRCKTFLTKQKVFPETDRVIGKPSWDSQLIPINADDKAYFLDAYSGNLSRLKYDIKSNFYYYDEEVAEINVKKLVEKKSTVTFNGAVYLNNKIYFTAIAEIKSSDYTIGYDSFFGYYDLSKKKAVRLCDYPDAPTAGISLAKLGKKFYIIGGYDSNNQVCKDDVFKYDSKSKSFKLLGEKLPVPRAHTKFCEYNGVLVGAYGAQDNGKMPQIITFDGSKWKTSSVKLESYDTIDIELFPGNWRKCYFGNVGLGQNGVFMNGSAVDGLGDSYTYDPVKDKVTPFGYTTSLIENENHIFGVTLPGCFIGFTALYDYDDDDDIDWDYAKNRYRAYASDDDDKDDDDKDGDSDETDEVVQKTYLVKLKNTKSDPEKQTYIDVKKSVTMYVKGTTKLAPKIRNAKGKTTYASSNKKIVTVDKNGKLTAIKSGAAKITVKNNGVKTVVKVTVKNPTLNKAKLTLKKGKSFTLKIKGKIGKAIFTSANTKVAKVSSSGKITAVSKGTTAINVKTNGIKLTCKVTVK